jgi:hypothetical protein
MPAGGTAAGKSGKTFAPQRPLRNCQPRPPEAPPPASASSDIGYTPLPFPLRDRGAEPHLDGRRGRCVDIGSGTGGWSARARITCPQSERRRVVVKLLSGAIRFAGPLARFCRRRTFNLLSRLRRRAILEEHVCVWLLAGSFAAKSRFGRMTTFTPPNGPACSACPCRWSFPQPGGLKQRR